VARALLAQGATLVGKRTWPERQSETYGTMNESRIDAALRWGPQGWSIESVTPVAKQVGGSFPHGCGGAWSPATWVQMEYVVTYVRSEEAALLQEQRMRKAGYRN
jgi:hypothetical protein